MCRLYNAIEFPHEILLYRLAALELTKDFKPQIEKSLCDWDYCLYEFNQYNTKVNPCGNYSDTSQITDQSRFSMKGSIGHDFSICIRTENQN